MAKLIMLQCPLIFQDIECIEAKADILQTTMASYTVRGDGDGPGGRFMDIGVVLYWYCIGVQVLNGLQSINFACILLYGLIYALNLTYPKALNQTFVADQKILMDLVSDKPSTKVRALKLKLLIYCFCR